VQRVRDDPIRPVVYRCILNDANRSNRANLISFVPRWRGSITRMCSSSPVILWLGELRSSTTRYIVDMNTSGRSWALLEIWGQLTDALYQLLLGTHEEELGSKWRGQP